MGQMKHGIGTPMQKTRLIMVVSLNVHKKVLIQTIIMVPMAVVIGTQAHMMKKLVLKQLDMAPIIIGIQRQKPVIIVKAKWIKVYAMIIVVVGKFFGMLILIVVMNVNFQMY